jgi:hypothetical protein
MSDAPVIRALDALIEDYPPTLYGRQPLWYFNHPAFANDVRTPLWRWKVDGFNEIEPEQLLRLDVNGAWIAPLSGTPIAHSALQHTGPKPYDKHPGYWLIDTPEWHHPYIPSPLGTRRRPARSWVTTPTIHQLIEMEDEGLWPSFQIYDSWTCPTQARMSAWARWNRENRAEALDQREDDPEYYDAVKQSYVDAYMLLRGPKPGEPAKSKVKRLDWFHTLMSSQAANTWRKAWWMTSWGIRVLALRNVDQIVIWRDDYEQLQKAIAKDPKAKVTLDQTGHKLGGLKIVEAFDTADEPEDQAA